MITISHLTRPENKPAKLWDDKYLVGK